MFNRYSYLIQCGAFWQNLKTTFSCFRRKLPVVFLNMSLIRLFTFDMKQLNCRTSRLFYSGKSFAGKQFIRTSVVFHSSWRKYLNDVTTAYEQVLERRFPRVYKIYRLFVVGSQNFIKDSKEFMRIRKEVSQGKKISNLGAREIEIYYQMPKEFIRVVPIIVVASLPFTNYFIFPLIYLFPRQLLSTHFWSLEQRVDFALVYHKKRLRNNRTVFRYLQASLANLQNQKLRENCQQIFHKLGSGVHPTAEEILLAKEAFAINPYNLTSLSSGHVTSLCWMHGLSVVGFRKTRLKNHAQMIQYLDVVLKREDIRKLNVDDMRKACFLRGVNPIGMQRDDIIKYLEQWITITNHVNSETASLLLHCPILLAYNQPTNWSLTH